MRLRLGAAQGHSLAGAGRNRGWEWEGMVNSQGLSLSSKTAPEKGCVHVHVWGQRWVW